MVSLTTTIEVPAGQTDVADFRVFLRIANHSRDKVTLLNPDMGIPAPEMNWPWSNETNQTSLLISFHYLAISVTDEAGQELPQQAIQTWATPALRPKLEQANGDSVDVAIRIGNFYQLASGKSYLLALEYGDLSLKVSAQTSVTIQCNK